MKIRMPGKSYRGELPPLTADELVLRDELRRHVGRLAGEIGQRNLPHLSQLQKAAAYVRAEFGSPASQEFTVEGSRCENLELEVRGGEEIVVVGGHYDSVYGSPGANDNASGAAAVLALARRFAKTVPARTLRFVAFVNEEPPYSYSPAMGSVRYAKRCRARNEKIVAMLSLETIGYYSDAPRSQQYPFPLSLFYPSRGDFIGFVGNTESASLVTRAIHAFRETTSFPSEGTAVPATIPGVGWSDHWSFWQEGYPAIMITDTAPYRYPHYHAATDTPEKLNYDCLARVVAGLQRVIDHLAGNRWSDATAHPPGKALHR
jgi:Zn-dependent M28 family amino/carboxypeptidase